MRRFIQFALLLLVGSPAWAATTLYYLNTAANGGSDSNSGTSSGSPWLTPNHSLTAPAMIMAAAGTGYSASNFQTFGTCTSSSGDLCWLSCATFDACKMTSSTETDITLGSDYWGIQGWELNTTTNYATYGNCIEITNASTNVHHIVIANNVLNGCGEFGVLSQLNGVYGVDYEAWVGNIGYDTSNTFIYNCNGPFSINQPINHDTLPGTHLYIAGNFAWDNFNANPCGPGGVGTPTDGDGVILDTFNGGSTSYTGQTVVDNNLLIGNGGRGVEVFDNNTGSPVAKIYIRHNTTWDNNQDTNQNQSYCGEILLNAAYNVEEVSNLAITSEANACGGYSLYAYFVGTGLTDTTTKIYGNWGYSAAGNNIGVNDSSGFVSGPGNVFSNPQFANPTVPGAPSCGSATSVPNCMATVIANFTPTNAAAKGYGYQIPSSTEVYDPLFPQWLCSVTNLPAGLIENGCLVASASMGSITGGTLK